MKPNHMHRQFNLFSTLLTLVLIMTTTCVFGNKAYVTNTYASGSGSLPDVISNSGAGDTIIIDVSGVVSISGFMSITHDLTIIGPGPVHFSIDYSSITAGLGAFYLGTTNANLHIEGIRFTASGNGHAFKLESSYTGTVNVFGCSFENSNSTVLDVDGGNLMVETCSFTNHTSSAPVAYIEANSTFVNCTFHGNNGNAIWANQGSTIVTHCTLFENGSGVGSGLAIQQMSGSVELRNNIIFNDSPTNDLITVGGGTLTSLGGNITNDMSTSGMPNATDIQSLTLDPGISASSIVKDGWGITYFPLQSDTCDAIDVDANPSGLPTYDARRVWRVMDAGFYNEYADAGAVEYTPLRVTSAGNGTPGTFEYVIQNTYPSLYGKTAVVFEITGTAPFVCQGSYLYISNDNTIINGFSQNESAIPGPGTTPGTVTAAYTPIVFSDISGSQVGLDVYGSDVTIAGVSMVGFSTAGASAIRISGFNAEISGCHIGVDEIGQNAVPNSRGILVYNGSAFIGAGKYCGKTYHANRNVVSGNAGCQITLNTMSTNFVQGNFVGLAADGLSIPTAVPSTPDTGIAIISMSASAGSLIGGSDRRMRNVVANQTYGILISAENNKLFNNYVGSDYSGVNSVTGSPNDYGIMLSGSMCFNNLIGKQGAGNVVVANNLEGINIAGASNNMLFGNYVGLGSDGLTPLGNTYSGIRVDGTGSTNNIIGEIGKANFISANNDGIKLTNGSYHTVVRGNYVGLGADSVTTIGNYNGIFIDNGSNGNMLGGCVTGSANIIGSCTNGIYVVGQSGSDNDTIYGNLIGILPSGANIGNSTSGIYIDNYADIVEIGQIGMGCANEIAFNGVGLATSNNGSSKLHISANSFHDNTGIGIDLDNDGANGTGLANVPNDNNGAQTPLLTSASDCGTGLNLGVQLEYAGNVVIEVYKATDGQEGDSLIIKDTIAFTTGVPEYLALPSLPFGMTLVATATYNDGTGNYRNTSEFSDAIPVTQVAALTPSISHSQVCFGGNTYPLLTVPGSTGTAVWFWDAGLTMRIEPGDTINVPEDDLFINGPGTFNYYVVDSIAGCYGTVSSPVTLDIIMPPSITITGEDTLCIWDIVGNNYSVSNSNGDTYTWYWYPSYDTASYSGAVIFDNHLPTITLTDNSEPTGGEDTLFVEVDSAGCLMTTYFPMVFMTPPYLDYSFNTNQPTQCGGTGSYEILTYDNNTPMTVYYNNGTTYSGSTDASGWFIMSGLPIGTYEVDSITNGTCFEYIYETFTLVEPSSPGFVASSTDLICNADASGQIMLTDTAGLSPFQYSIDGGGSWQTSNTFTGLAAGSYVCTIMDANSCLANDSTVILNEPVALSFTTVNLDDTCSLAKGEIQFSAVGGTMPYTYSIDGGGTYQSSAIFSGLMNGTYNLAVMDANGCMMTSSTTLNDQAGVSVVVNAYSSQVSCFDANDGYIDVLTTNPFGGSVTYQWTYNTSPFASTEDINTLYGGDYELIATDMGGCKDTVPVTIMTPAELLMSVVVTDETCSGYADGALDTTAVSGGTMPYSLDWVELAGNTSVGTTAPLTGLQAGDYAGVITDAYGCVAGDTVTINVGETYSPAVIVSNNDSCINNNSYTFSDDSGGMPSGMSATYSWTFENGSVGSANTLSATETFIVAGNNRVIYAITSSLGCIYRDTVYVDIYDTATVSLLPTDVSCFGASDGSVTATGTGGVGPYQYSFNGGVPAAVNSVSGLGAGTVTCYVVDVATGCQSETHYVGIAEPAQITFTATVSDATCGQSNGSVTFQNVSGGAGNYSYSADGDTYGSNTIIDTLSPGSYTFYVMDGNGCVESQTSSPVGNNGSAVPMPTIAEGSVYLVCMDNSGSYGYLTALSNDVSTGTFEWSMSTVGNVIGSDDLLYLDDFNTGNHYIYLVESNGVCESEADSVLLSVTATDVVDNTLKEFCLGDEVVLDLTTSGEVIWYSSMGEIADTTASMTTAVPETIPTTYYYTVGLGDCIFYDSITLVEDPDCDGIVIVNNAFSPNGDGINDLFRIDANALLSNDNTVVIINRWGDIIREYSNYDNMNVAWDGSNTAGDQVPAGTYFYVVEIPSIEYKTTGWIQVVR